MSSEHLPKRVLDAWNLDPTKVNPITSGWINRTFRVEPHVGATLVVQRLSPIFGAEVNEDIDAITKRLADRGVETPRLVRTRRGALWTEVEGSIWRALTFIDGDTVLRADTPERCRSGARLLGRFHRALWDFEYTFRHERLGVHDTRKHLAKLRAVLRERRDHPRHEEASRVGNALLAACDDLPFHDALPRRIVHGDPKIANLLFDARGQARCLVDLDTVARMPLAVELGDALRSWTAPRGEDAVGEVDLELYRATLEGYAESMGRLLPEAERAPIPRTAELIALELGCRFCADALEESYFAWDAERYATAAGHNLARAGAQLELARSLRRERTAIDGLMDAAWPAR